MPSEREPSSYNRRTPAVEKLEADLSGRIREMESRLRENDDLLNRRESELSELKISSPRWRRRRSKRRAPSVKISGERRTVSTRKTPLSMLLRSVSARASTRLRASSARSRIFSKRGSRNLEGSWPKPTRCPATWPELGTSKDQALRSLQEDLKLQNGHRSTPKGSPPCQILEERLNAKARSLEGQIEPKARAARRPAIRKLDALMMKVSELTQRLSEMDAEQDRSDRLLQEELREKDRALAVSRVIHRWS